MIMDYNLEYKKYNISSYKISDLIESIDLEYSKQLEKLLQKINPTIYFSRFNYTNLTCDIIICGEKLKECR
jgi:hypothetical protein